MRYIITGATGYVGSMLVKHICKTTPDADVTDPISVEQLDIPCDGLIHCAAVTKSAVMQAHPSVVTRSIDILNEKFLQGY